MPTSSLIPNIARPLNLSQPGGCIVVSCCGFNLCFSDYELETKHIFDVLVWLSGILL